MDEPGLLRLLEAQFTLDWEGIHGIRHWGRVRENGLRLAPLTGAKPRVVELFAFLHDSKRENDGHDPEHGHRAAAFARTLAGSMFDLESGDLDLLAAACRDHSNGSTQGDVTVVTCWDADRLDLGRVGVKPSPRRLCTAAARDPAMIEWAFLRSLQ
jgi:uncharacterized protein